MSSTPLISVVMAAYNAQRYVADAVESILGQTLGDFEFIVLNDGSSDDTGAILARFAQRDPRIVLIDRGKLGLIPLLQIGCEQARGQYIARMDADDISLPRRFEMQTRFLDAHPSIALVGGAAQLMNDAGLLPRFYRHPTDPVEIRQVLKTQNPIIQPAVMLRKDAMAAVGGYRKAFFGSEDYDLWLRMSEKFDLANLDEVVLNYRLHSQQISTRTALRQLMSKLGAQQCAALRGKGGGDPADRYDQFDVRSLLDLGMDAGFIEKQVLTMLDMLLHSDQNPIAPAAALQTLDEAQSSLAAMKLSRGARAQLRWLRGRALFSQGRAGAGLASALSALCLQPGLLARAFNFAVRSVRNRQGTATS